MHRTRVRETNSTQNPSFALIPKVIAVGFADKSGISCFGPAYAYPLRGKRKGTKTEQTNDETQNRKLSRYIVRLLKWLLYTSTGRPPLESH